MNLFRKLFSVPSETSKNFTTATKETEVSDENKAEDLMNIWDCGSPLYDSYELASLGHVIERHFMVLPSLSGSTQEKTQFSRESNVIPPWPTPSNDAAPKKLRGSYFSDFLEKSLFKSKMNRDRKGKLKKMKGGVSRIFNRINSGKK